MDKRKDGGISYIDEVEKIINHVTLQTGISPVNVSTWNSGDQYQRLLLGVLNLPKVDSIAKYIYSYDMPSTQKDALLHKINRTLGINSCAFFTSATSAISSIAMISHKRAIKKVVIVQPSYYTVQECFKSYNDIDVVSISLSYSKKDCLYHIPIDKFNDIKADVIWITQPVFSTGVYLLVHEICELCNNFPIVVIDCSLCSLNQIQLLSKAIPQNAIIIGSPHKLIGLNGLKFSYVVGSNKFIDELEDIIDINFGSLPITVPIALSHFLSENYESCSNITDTYILRTRKKCEEIYKSYAPNILYNLNSCGIYGMILVNNSILNQIVSNTELYRIFSHTFVAFIPEKTYDIHPNTCGFRVNYTLNENILIPAIGKLLTYLADHPQIF